MSRRTRVLFVVPRFASINRGVETFTRELVTRLDPERFEIAILTGPGSFAGRSITLEQGALIPRERMAWLDRVPAVARLFRPFGFGSAAEVEAFSLVRRYWTRWPPGTFDTVVPLGGSWTYKFARQTQPRSRVVSIGQAGPVAADLRRSNLFVALTPYDEDRARQLRPGIRTRVIPNGVDIDRFHPSEDPNGPEKAQTILCVGALVPDKRHDLLFDAALLLPQHVTVVLVGSGPHRGALERHPLALQGRVTFRQHTFEEMPEVYRQADAFSLASPDETFGIVLVEAMASGLPVVAHHGPRQRFVVGDGGILCDVRERQAYAGALATVLASPARNKARAEAIRFDWRLIAAQYSDVLA
jgi:glycosyltransferase involved in cell wall biosynthesis